MTTMQAGCVIFIINGTLVCEAKEFVISLYGRKNTQKKKTHKKAGKQKSKTILVKKHLQVKLYLDISTHIHLELYSN